MATLLRSLTIRKYLHLGYRSTVQYLAFALRQMTEWKPTWRHANEMIMGKKNPTQLFSFDYMSSRFVMSHLRDMVNLLRALPWKGALWVRCRYATYSPVTKHLSFVLYSQLGCEKWRRENKLPVIQETEITRDEPREDSRQSTLICMNTKCFEQRNSVKPRRPPMCKKNYTRVC